MPSLETYAKKTPLWFKTYLEFYRLSLESSPSFYSLCSIYISPCSSHTFGTNLCAKISSKDTDGVGGGQQSPNPPPPNCSFLWNKSSNKTDQMIWRWWWMGKTKKKASPSSYQVFSRLLTHRRSFLNLIYCFLSDTNTHYLLVKPMPELGGEKETLGRLLLERSVPQSSYCTLEMRTAASVGGSRCEWADCLGGGGAGLKVGCKNRQS